MTEIEFSSKSKSDLLNIKEYYSKIYIKYSKQIRKQINSSIHNLFKYPNFGKDSLYETKELVTGNYRIFYQLRENKIFIVRIIHFKMDFT